MTKPTNPQSLKRYSDSIGSLFCQETAEEADLVFIKSSSDVGVERNGGRNGARFAPKSLLAHFKKFTKSPNWENKSLQEFEVADQNDEKLNFETAQTQESAKIKKVLGNKPYTHFCHIGGGHDHVKPLLECLAKDYKKIVVINIDAHADTRIDSESHSGTPFRQFSSLYEGDFQLFQIGLHPYANSPSTLSALQKGSMHFLWRNDLDDATKVTTFFSKISALIDSETAVLFSLDADALSGHEVPGVSAVNGNGLNLRELMQLWERYKSLPLKHHSMLGIYELNPVYDTLSGISMRTMSAFLFESLG